MVAGNEGQGSLSKQQIVDWFKRADPAEVTGILPQVLDQVATFPQQHLEEIARNMSSNTRSKLFREPVG